MRSVFPLLDNLVVSVGRHFVRQVEEAVLLQFDEVKELVEGIVESFAVKVGWGVDADGDSKGADFIVVLRG